MRKLGVFFVAAILMFNVTMIMAGNVPNPNMVIEETIGLIPTLDPAWSYDTGSGEAIWQIYDNLIQYNGSSISEFRPMLSTNVPNAEDGTILDNGRTYIFHIRQNVKFHNGDILTPKDVVYSIERAVIFDRAGGPSWMLAEPLLPMINGAYVDSIEQWAVKLAGVKSFDDLFVEGTRTPKNDKYKQALVDTFNLLNKDFEIRGNNVIIHLPHSYPPFLYILAHGVSESSILDERWAVDNGAWPGTADTWWKYHNPTREKDPLYSITNGTGPFTLDRWIKGREIVFKRFDEYWAGPAKIKYGVIKKVPEFTTRKLDLIRGEADIIYVPRQYMKQVENVSGVKISKGLPLLSIDVGVFNFNINSRGNPYIGSGKLDGNGIPSDFFSNKDVRLAFEYLFPYNVFIKQVWMGQAIVPNSVVPKGLFAYDENVPKAFGQNLSKAREYFKKAYNGELWNKGFTMTLVYNSGNIQRQTACEMIKYYARRINPKFKVNVVSELWASFLDDYESGKLPFFVVGWSADYPDPYDFEQPFYASKGVYGSTLGSNYIKWAKKNMNPLLMKSMQMVEQAKRAQVYQKMNIIAHDQALYMFLDQPLSMNVRRSWINGWYYNPMRPGIDFYSLSK